MNDTRVTSYVYDANGNLTSLTNVLGQTETKKYDNMNRLVQETDAVGAKTTYQYDRKDSCYPPQTEMGIPQRSLTMETAM